MNRLTIKDKAIRDNFNAEYAKLADLEDIEEELGIDLITLFKALNKNTPIYAVYDDKDEVMRSYAYNHFCEKYNIKNLVSHKTIIELDNIVDRYIALDGLVVGDEIEWESTFLSYKDYGKTWSLRKEELL